MWFCMEAKLAQPLCVPLALSRQPGTGHRSRTALPPVELGTVSEAAAGGGGGAAAWALLEEEAPEESAGFGAFVSKFWSRRTCWDAKMEVFAEARF